MIELDEDWMDEGSRMVHNEFAFYDQEYSTYASVECRARLFQVKNGIRPSEWAGYSETRPYPLKYCNLCGLNCAYTPNSKAPASVCHRGQVTSEDQNQTTLDKILKIQREDLKNAQ